MVIGAGTAGLVAAHAAAALGAKVAPIERDLLGGDCLNVGCVPSKAIIRSSRLYAEMRDTEQYGARIPADIRVDFAAVMERMRGIRARTSRADSVHRLIASGVDVFFGQACFTGADALTVDGFRLRFKKALITTGARLDTHSIPGLVEAGYLTNENVFDLSELPHAFRRLGAQTVIVQDKPLFLRREERDAAQLLSDAFARDGIEVRLNTRAVNVRVEGVQTLVDLVSDYKRTAAVDAILTGTGRLPNVEGLNLEAAGVDCDATTGVGVNDFLQTSNPRIYATGDACLELEPRSGRLQQRLPARWRPRRRAGLQSEVGEDALDHRRLQDGGDDLQLAAAVRAVFEVDLEGRLEQPGPTHSHRPAMRTVRLAGSGLRCLGALGRTRLSTSWPAAMHCSRSSVLRRARDVAAQLLQRLAVVGAAAHGGVQAETLHVGALCNIACSASSVGAGTSTKTGSPSVLRLYTARHQAVQVDVQVGGRAQNFGLGWISVTAPLSAWSAFRPDCSSRSGEHTVHDPHDRREPFQNFIIMPMTFLSGVFYSVHSPPPFRTGSACCTPTRSST